MINDASLAVWRGRAAHLPAASDANHQNPSGAHVGQFAAAAAVNMSGLPPLVIPGFVCHRSMGALYELSISFFQVSSRVRECLIVALFDQISCANNLSQVAGQRQPVQSSHRYLL